MMLLATFLLEINPYSPQTCAECGEYLTDCTKQGKQVSYEEKENWFSHELNLASTGDSPLQWIVGAYYYDENYTQPVSTTLLDMHARTGDDNEAATGRNRRCTPCRERWR